MSDYKHNHSKNKRRHHNNYRDDYRDRRDGNEREYEHQSMNDGSYSQRPQQYDQEYNFSGRKDYQRHNNDQRQSDQQWQQNKLSRSFSGSRNDNRGGNPRQLVFACNIDHYSALVKASATKPTEIASFSITDGVRSTPGSVKLYHAPTLPLDLNIGFDTRTLKQEAHSNIDPVIATLNDNQIDLSDVHFISFRNNFNKILGAPYSNNPWEIDVYRQNNIIYFDVVKLEERNSAFGEKATYWGYKFEEYCTAGIDDNGAFDPNNQFCRLLKLQIDGHTIIIGAEIDCYELDSEPKEGEDIEMKENNENDDGSAVKYHYVELKTAKSLDNFREEGKFRRYKMMNFWIQSFLGDVPEIKVGFRDDKGIVNTIESFQTLEVPKYAEHWDAQKCLNFASSLLSLLKLSTQNNKRYTMTFNHPFTHVELHVSQKEGSFL